ISDNSPAHNEYGKKRDVQDARLAFNTHADADVIICFTNHLADGFTPDPKLKRVVDVDFDIGAEAADYSALAKTENLEPLEVELRKLEKVVQEIWDEMEYLKNREAKMRDTNESTNERVQWFSLLTLFTLISLGIWQIFYLRRFFKRKRLID
ncbi:emp24/gp25L/p24 family/GOLD-domain-containing protein, partial [Jimgerdemannia flammicorona]